MKIICFKSQQNLSDKLLNLCTFFVKIEQTRKVWWPHLKHFIFCLIWEMCTGDILLANSPSCKILRTWGGMVNTAAARRPRPEGLGDNSFKLAETLCRWMSANISAEIILPYLSVWLLSWLRTIPIALPTNCTRSGSLNNLHMCAFPMNRDFLVDWEFFVYYDRLPYFVFCFICQQSVGLGDLIIYIIYCCHRRYLAEWRCYLEQLEMLRMGIGEEQMWLESLWTLRTRKLLGATLIFNGRTRYT